MQQLRRACQLSKATSRGDGDPAELSGQVEAVLAASRTLVAISAKSFASLETRVTVPQLRALVVIASLATTNLAFFSAPTTPAIGAT
jgi:hypothetical protein